jgi:hypothetical protein
MVNKVTAAFLAADGLFVSMGAIMLGFSVVVLKIRFTTATDGETAARDLLYQQFPLTGEPTDGRWPA